MSNPIDTIKRKRHILIAAAALILVLVVFLLPMRRYARAQAEEAYGNPLAAAEIYYSLGPFRGAGNRADALWTRALADASEPGRTNYDVILDVIQSEQRAGRLNQDEARRLRIEYRERQVSLLMQYGKYLDAAAVAREEKFTDSHFGELYKEALYQAGLSFLDGAEYTTAQSEFGEAGDYGSAASFLAALDGKYESNDMLYYEDYADPGPDGERRCLWLFCGAGGGEAPLQDCCALIMFRHRSDKTLEVTDLRLYRFTEDKDIYRVFTAPYAEDYLHLYGEKNAVYFIVNLRNGPDCSDTMVFSRIGISERIDLQRLRELAVPCLRRELALGGDPFYSAYTRETHTPGGQEIRHVCMETGCTNPAVDCYGHLPCFYYCPLHAASQNSAFRRYTESLENDLEKERKEIRDAEAAADRERRRSSSYSSHSSRKDPYDVDSFSDPDDFADEGADEFADLWDADWEDGYDDAYDYWMENH